MIAPIDGPRYSQLSCCGARYSAKQPIVHAPSCRQGRSGEGRSVAPVAVAVKRPDAGLAAEVDLATRLNDAGLTGWETQFFWALSERSAKGRPIQYRADLAYPKQMVLIESEGGCHTVRRQWAADCLRASLAAALGYRMLRVTKQMIEDAGPHGAVALVRRALIPAPTAGREE